MPEPPVRLRDPSASVYRWIVMLAAGLMLFGGAFAYDSIASISQRLTDQDGYTATEVGLMDSVYSWLSVVVVFVAGMLIDKFGTKATSLVFSGLVALGAVIVAMAPSFIVLLVGRAVLGLGFESLAICQSTILQKWFKAKHLALSFGFALVFLRLGSIASQNLGIPVAERHGGTAAAFWLAAILCGFSLGVAIVYVVLEAIAERKVELVGTGHETFVFADILKFDARFWTILVFVMACYGGILPFRALAQDFFHDEWGIVPETGGALVSILAWSSMILAPIIGWVVDRKGRRATLLLCSPLLLIVAHLLLGMSSLHPLVPMLVLGLAYALVAAVVWPSVPLVVDAKSVATAYGLIFMFQNAGLALLPVLNGKLRDVTASYAASELMFAGLGVVALVAAVVLVRVDREHGSVLEREVMQERA